MSCRRKGFTSKPQGATVGDVPVDNFINELSEETDGMLIKFLDGTNLKSRPESKSKKISTG